MWWVLLGVLLAAMPAWARQQPAPAARPARAGSVTPTVENAEERLARARQAYLSNDFPAAIEQAAPLLYPDVKLRREEDVIAAHRLLALAYLLNQQREPAEREFLALLALQPDFALDPVLDPPQALAFLEGIKTSERQRIEELERRRRAAAEAAARAEELKRQEEEARRIEELRKTLRPIVVEHHDRLQCFVPFGVGQFQNRQNAKGLAFLTTQVALGFSSLALWTTLEVRYDAGRRRVPDAEFDSAKAMQYSHLVLGGLFWADVAWGMIDALVHFRPEVIVDDPGFIPPPPRTSLAPLVLPGGGAGLSIQGAF